MSDDFDYGEASIGAQQQVHLDLAAKTHEEASFVGRQIEELTSSIHAELNTTDSQMKEAKKTDEQKPIILEVGQQVANTATIDAMCHKEIQTSLSGEPAQKETISPQPDLISHQPYQSDNDLRLDPIILAKQTELALMGALKASKRAEIAAVQADAAADRAEAAAEKAENSMKRIEGEKIKETSTAIKETSIAVKEASTEIKHTTKAAKIYSKDELQTGIKEFYILEKRQDGKKVLVRFSPDNQNHHREHQNQRIIKANAKGEYSLGKDLLEELHKAGPLFIQKEDGTEVEVDKGKLREFTADEREELNTFFKQYETDIGFKVQNLQTNQNQESDEKLDGKNQAAVLATSRSAVSSSKDEEYVNTSRNNMAQFQQTAGAKRQAEETKQMIRFNATMKKLRLAGEKRQQAVLEEKMQYLKQKLETLQEHEYEDLQNLINIQVDNEQDLKFAITNLQLKMISMGIITEAEKLTSHEIDFLASEIVRLGMKNQKTEFIVVLQNFLNNSLEKAQDGGRAYQERAVIETKVNQTMIAILSVH